LALAFAFFTFETSVIITTDIAKALARPENKPIFCIDMYTSGEPTRIILNACPDLPGTLLEQRSQIAKNYDNIRECLMPGIEDTTICMEQLSVPTQSSHDLVKPTSEFSS
jgi:hypothetical protein